MKAYLLDTNHIGLAVNRASSVGQRIFEARMDGLRVGTCLPVLCEIEAGMRYVRQPVKYRRDLNHLLLQLRLWPIDLTTARLYGDLLLGTAKKRLHPVASRYDGGCLGPADEADAAHHRQRF